MNYESGHNYSAIMLHLLHFLGRDPDSSYHVREIAEKSGVSVGAASITLRAMKGTGLVTSEERGSMKFYTFNLFNPLSREWKVLFNIQDLKGLVDELTPYVDRIVLFGSCANGTDSKESDVDLFITTHDKAKVSHILARFQKNYFRNLSPIIQLPEGLAKIRKSDRPMFESILQGRVLWPKL